MPITRKVTEETESNLIKRLIFIYRPYWVLFTLLAFFFIGGAFLYLMYATHVYEATARILIKDEKKGVEEAKTVESLDGFSGKNIIENELEVIKSPALIDEVVAALQLYAPITQHTSIKNISGYNICPVRIQAQNLSDIKKTLKVPFTYNAANKTISLNNKEYKINKYVATPYGNFKFFDNPEYIPATNTIPDNNYFFDLLPVRYISEKIDKGLIAESPNKLSSIIYLKYRDEVPERAEDIINTLLASYNNATLTDKNGLSENTLSFIDERLKYLKQDLDTIERKIQRFKSRNDASDISTQGKLFLQNVSTNDQKLGEINMQLAVLNQVNKYITAKNGADGIVPSTLGVNDPTLSQLVNRLYTSELQYENFKKTTGENNPVAVAINDQINKIRPSILENIESQRKSLEASRSNLAYTNNSFASTLQGMPEKERQLLNIDREQGTKNQIYNFLLQKREETALSHASNVANNRVVDKARTSDIPVSPKGKVVYLASLLASILIGIIIVMAKEKLRGKIMFIHDIEMLTSYPIIAEISSEISKNPIVIAEGRRTLIAEQFRKIRATLSYLDINTTRKRIMVTSSISGEGKSFVAVNLALSLAIAGKKVALLDFDLNNPSLNNKLSIDKQRGITQYLLGKNTAEEIILQTATHENLYLLPTGELPENPSELIMNGKTEKLLQYLDTIFDYIIIDVAPVAPVTDAYLLSPFCDVTLYIVRHNYTPKIFVERIDENNKIHHLKNIAIIFNGVSTRGFGVKDYGYGYERPASYGYGYVYSGKKPKLLSGPKN